MRRKLWLYNLVHEIVPVNSISCATVHHHIIHRGACNMPDYYLVLCVFHVVGWFGASLAHPLRAACMLVSRDIALKFASYASGQVAFMMLSTYWTQLSLCIQRTPSMSKRALEPRVDSFDVVRRHATFRWYGHPHVPTKVRLIVSALIAFCRTMISRIEGLRCPSDFGCIKCLCRSNRCFTPEISSIGYDFRPKPRSG